MEKIELNDEDVVELDHLTDDIRGLHILLVNVFGIASGVGGWTLVDAGLRLSARRIRTWAERQFGADVPPDSIIMTHGHFDHVGALKELAEHWDVPVYAHPLELPYLTGAAEYPPPDPNVGGGLMARLSFLYPRGAVDVSDRVRPLPDDGSVPGLPGWRWMHTPGHTVGHVSFYREADRALIVGDAFCTTRQESFLAALTQPPELHGPPAYYTPDWDAARESVRRLAALEPVTIVPSHGRPIAGPHATQSLRELAAAFDEVARPEQGRYVTPRESPLR
jgi:glyoxylase-like metal-dependent hydrolase (beta-lactamase superfamily II)